MRIKAICATAIVAVCGAGTVAGISTGSAGHDGAVGRVHHGPARIEVSRVKNFASLAALRDQSTAIATVTAMSARKSSINGVPATVTTLRVDRAAWGHALPATLEVLQFGTDDAFSPDTSQLFIRGDQYLVYVTKYHLAPTDDTGLYVLTGDQGVFAVRGATLVFTGGGDPGFGRQIALSDLETAVTR